MVFPYKEAFQCNIGILSEEEQERIRNFTIAIPGMGGVGGDNLITFLRAGFERFKIADFDVFELKNINRQYGASLSSLGRNKSEVMKEIALDINPNSQIESYNGGICRENLDSFLEGVNLSIDSLDFFEVDIRRDFINESLERKIPVINAGPIGYGTSCLIFKPDGLNFDEYFGVNDENSYNEKMAAFIVGLAPYSLHRKYIKADLRNLRGPSIKGGVNLCSSMALANGIKLLLNRGDVKSVPYFHQFDPYLNKYICKKVIFGYRNPIQRLKRKVITDVFEGKDSWFKRFFLKD